MAHPHLGPLGAPDPLGQSWARRSIHQRLPGRQACQPRPVNSASTSWGMLAGAEHQPVRQPPGGVERRAEGRGPATTIPAATTRNGSLGRPSSAVASTTTTRYRPTSTAAVTRIVVTLRMMGVDAMERWSSNRADCER